MLPDVAYSYTYTPLYSAEYKQDRFAFDRLYLSLF